MTLGDEALDRFIAARPGSVLDIGSGDGIHASFMREAGLKVTTVDLNSSADYCANYVDVKFDRPFDAIWCCHVLEHVRNVGSFLEKMFNDLKAHGLLAITVPPMRTKLVDAHVNCFTSGSLVYNLILAGFDCHKARVGIYGYNISVLVNKRRASIPPLTHNKGDLARIAHYFPWHVSHGCDGRLDNVRWD